MFHINQLEEAQHDSNPARFRMAFDHFKAFTVQYWNRIDYDLNAKTRKQIIKVFDIENSPSFKGYRFLSNNLDYVFRYGYAMCFLFFLFFYMGHLY